MKFDEAARRAAEALQRQANAAVRPSIGEVQRARRRRSGLTALATTTIVTVAVVGGLAVVDRSADSVPPATSPPFAASTTTTEEAPTAASSSTAEAPATSSTTSSTTTAAPVAPLLQRWSIASNPEWHRADSDLMPNLGWDSLTLATFPLRRGGANCAHLPENALRDLGTGDALVSVFFADAIDVFLGSTIAGPRPWPAGGLDDGNFPPADGLTDAHECAERPELEIHWDAWRNGSDDLYVLVAFGGDVDAATRATAWATLSSLTPLDDAEGRACVVTVPTDPGFAPPEPYPPRPSPPGMEWYGTSALWVPLPADGSFVPTKSVWWSEDFDVLAGEERPEISVQHERIDVAAPIVLSDGPGTNANTSEDGWFMIADMELLETPGCWRMTAEYREAKLSYVVLVP